MQFINNCPAITSQRKNAKSASSPNFSGLKVHQGEEAFAEVGNVIIPPRYVNAFLGSREMRSAGRKYKIELSALSPYGARFAALKDSNTMAGLASHMNDTYNPIVIALTISKNSWRDKMKSLFGTVKPEGHRMFFEPSNDYKVYWDFKGLRKVDIDAFVQREEVKASVK